MVFINLFSADCLDFELKPVEVVVHGSLGGNGNLQWNIKRENKTDQLFTANLFLVGPTLKQLYSLDAVTHLPVKLAAEDTFGERISANIQDGKTYEVKLQNLSYSDKASFQLVVQINRGDATSNIKRSRIQLIVEGMKQYGSLLFLFLQSFGKGDSSLSNS